MPFQASKIYLSIIFKNMVLKGKHWNCLLGFGWFPTIFDTVANVTWQGFRRFKAHQKMSSGKNIKIFIARFILLYGLSSDLGLNY